jgi:hypothetical protein
VAQAYEGGFPVIGARIARPGLALVIVPRSTTSWPRTIT